MCSAPTLAIIGAGKLGRTLGRLFAQTGVLQITAVCNQTRASAKDATRFIGAGTACDTLADLTPSDLVLIATPDAHIAGVSHNLLNMHPWASESVLFHGSGALCSDALRPHTVPTLDVASVHPIKSFASPKVAIETFHGTYCGIEGTPRAVAELRRIFKPLGAHLVTIDASHKTAYHCAAVFANNYLVTLIHTAQRLYAQAGIDDAQSLAMMMPILEETLQNVLQLGTHAALTGPIARNDTATVENHMRTLNEIHPSLATLYQHLGQATADIAAHANERPTSPDLHSLLTSGLTPKP